MGSTPHFAAGVEAEANLRPLVDDLADQLTTAIDSEFEVTVTARDYDESTDRLQYLINSLLDTARNAIIEATQTSRELEQKNEELAKTGAELGRAQRRIEELTVRAEAGSRTKAEFLANVNHEIRTPMAAIMGYAELLRAHASRDASYSQFTQTAQAIQGNGERLLAIIDDILELAGMETAAEVSATECSPVKLLADLQSLMNVRAAAKGLTLQLEFDGPIPERVATDPARLVRALTILVENAIKFTPAGEVRVVTRIVTDRPHRLQMQVDVRDTGMGVAPEEADRLFEPFTQGDGSASRTSGGAGLGLAVARKCARLLGGDVLLLGARPGRGSCFRLQIPVQQIGTAMIPNPATALKTEPAHDAGPRCSTQTALGGLRILLAEDSPDNQRLISFVLEQAGGEVTVVGDGRLALEKALSAQSGGRPYDVVLMDMQMPTMDGYQATRCLRCKGYIGPIIAVTAHAMSTDRQECLDVGCDHYLTKPLDREQLVALVRQCAQAAPTPAKCQLHPVPSTCQHHPMPCCE